MRGAYGRPRVDRRVRERLRTGSGDTSEPGRTGQDRARRRIDGNRIGIARADFAFFSTRIDTVVGGKCNFGAKKGPYISARSGRLFVAQNWH